MPVADVSPSYLAQARFLPRSAGPDKTAYDSLASKLYSAPADRSGKAAFCSSQPVDSVGEFFIFPAQLSPGATGDQLHADESALQLPRCGSLGTLDHSKAWWI